jgi:exopolysaccharide biosynthesis protein
LFCIIQLSLLDYFASKKRHLALGELTRLHAASSFNGAASFNEASSNETPITSVNPSNWIPLSRAKTPQITQAKITAQEVFNTLELEFSSIIKVTKQEQRDGFIQFKLEPSIKPISFEIWHKLQRHFTGFSIKQHGTHTEIAFKSSYPFSDPFTDMDSHGTFKLFIPYIIKKPELAQQKGTTIEPGLTYHKDRVCVADNKYANIHILRLEQRVYKNRLLPVLADEGIARRETLSGMVNRRDAVVGINAGYFTAKGDPLGTLIIDRKLVSSPLYDRSVFGITDENKVVFGNPKFSGYVRATGLEVPIDAVNQPRRGDKIVIFTSEYARNTLTELPGIELVLIKGKVCGIQSQNALIPPDGVVISVGGDKTRHFKHIKLGDSIQLDYSVAVPWNTIKHAICGGPRLIENGEISINDVQERFSTSIANARHPRTAIGLSVDNSLILMVVEGRSAGSVGMTLKEMALYMKRLGVRHGINLDGGGSSTMVINNRVVNSTSDGAERRISNGILLLRN